MNDSLMLHLHHPHLGSATARMQSDNAGRGRIREIGRMLRTRPHIYTLYCSTAALACSF